MSPPIVQWQRADSPELLPDQIHVWRIRVEGVDASAESLLDAREKARLDALPGPRTQARYLATRVGMRTVLAGYLGIDPAAAVFHIRDGGKPGLADGPQFNLSHSGELALLAVAGYQVGIDVEPLRAVPRRLAIARRVWGAAEAERLAQLPETVQDAAFLHAWTAMEARQKCFGEGVFGRPVTPLEVGELAFQPASGYLAQLAWEDRAHRPEVLFFRP